MGALQHLEVRHIAGGAAGNLTVTGIKKGDRLVSVTAFGLTEGIPNTFSGFADLTSEFTITADDTINNTGGTSSAAKLVTVIWDTFAGGRSGIRNPVGRSAY